MKGVERGPKIDFLFVTREHPRVQEEVWAKELLQKPRVRPADKYLAQPPGGYTSGVYVLVDPREPTRPRYVGSSEQLERRAWTHASVGGGRGNSPKAKWARSLRADGVGPVMLLLQGTTPGALGKNTSVERDELEYLWVERLKPDLNQRFGLRTDVLSRKPNSSSVIHRRLRLENQALRAEGERLRAIISQDLV